MKMQNLKFDDEKQNPQITNAMTPLDEKCEFVNLPTKKRNPNTLHGIHKVYPQPKNVQKPKSVDQKTESKHDQPFISNNEKIAHNQQMCTNQNLLTKKRNRRTITPSSVIMKRLSST